ncbi:MAG: alpha/beta hydrolase [Burkholderiales bacterium]|nr:alpha/beta hydrolase [Burkholderiales bacterium]
MASPSVVFLPGLLEDAGAFARQIERLRPLTACVVADLTRGDTIAELAKEALLQAPEGPLALVGHSMGGYVALELMRQAPQRIDRLALLNTHARPDSPEATENRKRLMTLAEKDFPAVIRQLLPKLLTEEHLLDLEMAGTLTEMALGIGKDAFVRQQRAIVSRIDSRPHLGAIRCPTQVVAAREDALMPVDLLQELANGIPGAKLAVIERCGHVAPIERPGEVAKILLDWFQAA